MLLFLYTKNLKTSIKSIEEEEDNGISSRLKL